MERSNGLPKNWITKAIGEVCEFEYGKGLTKKNRDELGKYNVYGSNGVVGKHSEFLIDDPSVIVGRKGAAGEVHLALTPFWPIDTTYFVRNPDGFDLKFFYYQLKTLRLSSLDTSTAIPGLNRNDAYKKSVVIPPIQEQKRIVAKIEELFSELDAGVESLKKAQQQLKTYRQSVLKSAFEGKLTTSWRLSENGPRDTGALLQIIETEREETSKATGVRQRQVPQITNDETDKLGNIAEEWRWVRPDQIAAPEKYALGIGPFGSNLKVSDYTSDGCPLVFVKNITRNDFALDEKYVSPAKYTELIAHSVKPLDIVVTKMGDPPGDSAIYPENAPPGIITSDCLKFRVWDKHADRKFYRYCIESVLVKKQLGLITKGVAQKKISLDRFRSICLPFTSLNEQKRVVEEIESRLSVSDKLGSTIEQEVTQAEALRQSILKQAFEGKLI
jgi:type I restriction enzyme, S subunit